MINIAIVAALCLALAASASAQAVDQTACAVRYPGAYHLSCYAANETVATVYAAKVQCHKAFTASNASCVNTSFIVSNGTAKYGCGTYIIYGFGTTDCLNAYQNQEKTNTNCTIYDNAGLGQTYNRNTNNVTIPANCTEPGPCPVNATNVNATNSNATNLNAVKAGWYHLSCYAANETATVVAAAKSQCITAFTTANVSCATGFNGGLYGTNLYDCGTYIGYGFTTLDCINAYQAFEKATTSAAGAATGACSKYVAAGLGAPVNRNTATPFVPSPYQCGTSGMKRVL